MMSNLTTEYSFLKPISLAPIVPPSEQVAVVTGANQGLGFGIVKGLCEQFDGYIYLTARDKKKGAEAVQVLKDMKVCKHPEKLRFHEFNVLNEEHTDNFYHYLKDEHGGIDILVNNGAIAYKRESYVPVAEQIENTIRTNYLAVVRTCVFLFPLLRRHGRVVNLSSSAGHLSQVSHYELKKRLLDDGLTEKKLTDIMYEVMDMAKADPMAHVNAGWPNSAYAISKIGVNLLTRIYQQKFDTELGNQDRVINSVHPGYPATNMSSYMGNVNIFEAAEVPIYCALLPPNIKEPRGQLVWSDYNIVDMDSPTTPETSTDDIEHFDIVHDIREYSNYFTSSQLPPFDNEMLERNWILEDETKAGEVEGQKGKEEEKKNEQKVEQNVKETGAPKREAPHAKQSDKTAARAVRSLKDDTTATSMSYRTATRPILPEDWISMMMWKDTSDRLLTTIPGCK